MKNTKILITGGTKQQRLALADTIDIANNYQGIRSEVTDLGKYAHDAITSIEIPKSVSAVIFVAHNEEKKFAGIYERAIKGSQDNLEFLHIEIK